MRILCDETLIDVARAEEDFELRFDPWKQGLTDSGRCRRLLQNDKETRDDYFYILLHLFTEEKLFFKFNLTLDSPRRFRM